jgi:hypothetical protein
VEAGDDADEITGAAAPAVLEWVSSFNPKLFRGLEDDWDEEAALMLGCCGESRVERSHGTTYPA